MSTMKKRIPMFLLALAMMVAMALPTFAASPPYSARVWMISQKNARKFIALTKQVKIHIFPKHNLWKYLMILENIS